MSQLEDYFNKQKQAHDTQKENNETKENLNIPNLDFSKKINEQRLEWTRKIIDISKKLKTAEGMSEHLCELYSERQTLLEQYHYMVDILSKIYKIYRPLFMKRYKYYMLESQLRFNNESARTMQIQSDLLELTYQKELLEEHVKFMHNSISSIDNIIYGVKHKVDLIKIATGR